MHFADVLATALSEIRANKLRSFFTLLGIIVSVAFLVAVVAVIQGMNAYVTQNVANSVMGTNAFQVRRVPVQLGFFDDEQWNRVAKRPALTRADFEIVRAALPDARAVAITSGFPTPLSDITWGNRTVGDVTIRGITPPYQEVQDYRIERGRPLIDADEDQRRAVAVVGFEVADKLFQTANPIGQSVRLGGDRFEVVGVLASKGRVLGQSFDALALIPLSRYEMIYGHRASTSISVKMAAAVSVADGMHRAEEAMRMHRRLRPGQENNFSVETAEALVAFWKSLTAVLFSVIPAVVGIGVVVGGIVIMNIMLASVTERTREIGIRRSLGARKIHILLQFMMESAVLAATGGIIGVLLAYGLVGLVGATTSIPVKTPLSAVIVSLCVSTAVGLFFGIYPATRAAKLDPIEALRAET